MRKVPLEEQEVTINIYPSSVDAYADVFSSIPSYTKKLGKIAERLPDETSVTEVSDGVVMRFPAKWVKISPPRKAGMDDSKRDELSDRMKKINEDRRQKGES